MQKTLKGKIVSVKMAKTAVVEVIVKSPHPLYKKVIKQNNRYKVDTGDLVLTVGQQVKIIGTRPISKGKFFKVLEVIK